MKHPQTFHRVGFRAFSFHDAASYFRRAEMDTTYKAIGVQTEIEAAVQRFHERVASDPDLAYEFDGMDLRRIMAHQVTLLRSVLLGLLR